jgi:hypothetical protein
MQYSSDSEAFVLSSDEALGSSGILEYAPSNVALERLPNAYRIIDATIVGDLQVSVVSRKFATHLC